MTREEAIGYLKRADNTVGLKMKTKTAEAIEMAIKALKQEPILDKIRAEIEHIGGDDEKAFCKNLNESYKQGLKDALKVIDKYKGRREE